MEILIMEAARDARVEAGAARKALLGALALLDTHADPAAMRTLYDELPDAERLARTPRAAPKGGGGLFGGLMRSAGGVSGAAMADAMGLLNQLRSDGLDKDDLKPLVRAARDRVRKATGRDLLGEAVATVPGVGALIGG
jgi:hypothetical protein